MSQEAGSLGFKTSSGDAMEQPFQVDNFKAANVGATLSDSQSKASKEVNELHNAHHATGPGEDVTVQAVSSAANTSSVFSIQSPEDSSVGRQRVEASKQNFPGQFATRSGIPRLGRESPLRNPGTTHSPLHPQLPPGRLGRKSESSSPAFDRERRMAGSAIYASGTPGRVRTDKGSAIPRWRDWDETDAASGEGFTEKFENARYEKKIGVTLSAKSDSPARAKSESDMYRERSSFFSWLCCCTRH